MDVSQEFVRLREEEVFSRKDDEPVGADRSLDAATWTLKRRFSHCFLSTEYRPIGPLT
jgi:hypothetical protein